MATDEAVQLTALAQVPKEQKFVWKVTPLPGRFLDARTAGDTLSKICDLLTSNDMTGRAVFPALMGIRLTEDGAFEADIALLVVEEPAA